MRLRTDEGLLAAGGHAEAAAGRTAGAGGPAAESSQGGGGAGGPGRAPKAPKAPAQCAAHRAPLSRPGSQPCSVGRMCPALVPALACCQPAAATPRCKCQTASSERRSPGRHRPRSHRQPRLPRMPGSARRRARPWRRRRPSAAPRRSRHRTPPSATPWLSRPRRPPTWCARGLLLHTGTRGPSIMRMQQTCTSSLHVARMQLRQARWTASVLPAPNTCPPGCEVARQMLLSVRKSQAWPSVAA